MLSPLFISSPICYRMMRRGRHLKSSITNNMSKYSIVKHLHYTVYCTSLFHNKYNLAELTRYSEIKACSIFRQLLHSRPCRSSAVRRWLPTAAVRVRVRAACEVCGGQSGTGAGFLRVLRFPLPIIPPISPLS
jgi:hypothetical protein